MQPSTTVRLRASLARMRSLVLFHAIAIGGLCILVAYLLSSGCHHHGINGVLQIGAKGPWGQLECSNIYIEAPDEYVTLPPPDQPALSWVFSESGKTDAIGLLRQCAWPMDLIAEMEQCRWDVEPGGTRAYPDDRIILALPAEARRKLYSILIEHPANRQVISPIWFDQERLRMMESEVALQPATIALFKRLLYPGDAGTWLFADVETALRQLPDDRERRRFLQRVTRKTALLARLRLDTHTDLGALMEYWGGYGRKTEIQPLLAALIDSGGDIHPSLIALLPRFARDRLYLYPRKGSDEADKDCFWTAMNFFADPPDDRMLDLATFKRTIHADYVPIDRPSRLGDLIFLASPTGGIFHAAVHVADDVVFTKNGRHALQPWILMREDDMVRLYTMKHREGYQIKRSYYRRR